MSGSICNKSPPNLPITAGCWWTFYWLRELCCEVGGNLQEVKSAFFKIANVNIVLKSLKCIQIQKTYVWFCTPQMVDWWIGHQTDPSDEWGCCWWCVQMPNTNRHKPTYRQGYSPEMDVAQCAQWAETKNIPFQNSPNHIWYSSNWNGSGRWVRLVGGGW